MPIKRVGHGGVTLLRWSPKGSKVFTACPSAMFRSSSNCLQSSLICSDLILLVVVNVITHFKLVYHAFSIFVCVDFTLDSKISI